MTEVPNLFPDKDVVFFPEPEPEPVPGPDGEPAYVPLHRPMWNLADDSIIGVARLDSEEAS